MRLVCWVCDRCGKRIENDRDMLPRRWVVVNISSPSIKPTSMQWCEECQTVLNPPTRIPGPIRRIKTVDPDNGDESEEEEDDE